MMIVAGLSLKNLKPRVWDLESPYYLSGLEAVMISYADFHQAPLRRKKAMEVGLHAYLGVPSSVKIYLDNGAFYFVGRDWETPKTEYEEFVSEANPDWRPVPQDFIPVPKMTLEEQHVCLSKTMAVNRGYDHDGYVPVIHISQVLGEYITAVQSHDTLSKKPAIALGGIVPNLLRSPKAMAYSDVLNGLKQVRREFDGKQLHVFGIGGTATLHIGGLLGLDSADSSGWRNRAARGIIQMPGRGDRMVAQLGSWRGRRLSEVEQKELEACKCPACQSHGPERIKAKGIEGFCARATHNLWVLLEEAKWIECELSRGTYAVSFQHRLENSIYSPLIQRLVWA